MTETAMPEGGRIQRSANSQTPSGLSNIARLAQEGPYILITNMAEFKNRFRISRTLPEQSLDEENGLDVLRMISLPSRLVAPTPVPSLPTHLIPAQMPKHHLLRTIPSSLHRTGPATYETRAPGGLSPSGAAE